VQGGGGRRSRRQDERGERRETGVEPVDLALEALEPSSPVRV
jgi:hypothetical protein